MLLWTLDLAKCGELLRYSVLTPYTGYRHPYGTRRNFRSAIISRDLFAIYNPPVKYRERERNEDLDTVITMTAFYSMTNPLERIGLPSFHETEQP